MELEKHVNDLKSAFKGFDEKCWTKYVTEQSVIRIIRDMLPETAEWRFVKMKIMQGEPGGDDFDKAMRDEHNKESRTSRRCSSCYVTSL